MLETRKVDTQDTQGAFRRLTSIRYVTNTRYSENITEVNMGRSSVVNK